MRWLQHKNRIYSPLVLPIGIAGFGVSLALNRPAFGSMFAMIVVGSLATGTPKE